MQVPVPAPKCSSSHCGQIWLEFVLQVSAAKQLAMMLQAHGEAITTDTTWPRPGEAPRVRGSDIVRPRFKQERVVFPMRNQFLK